MGPAGDIVKEIKSLIFKKGQQGTGRGKVNNKKLKARAVK
jgi:hypothetical protein